MTDYLVRYAEIALKGKNRNQFEKQLIHNIRDTAQLLGKTITRITTHYGRFIVTGEHLTFLPLIYGVSSVSPAIRAPRNLDEITAQAIALAKTLAPGTVTIKTKRMDKSFPHKSPDVNRHIALALEEHTPLTPLIKDGEHTIGIEITSGDTYLHAESLPGFGGLPVGSGGHASIDIRTDADVLACLLVMKRGVRAHITSSQLGDRTTQLLLTYGASTSTTHTPYTISSQTLKSLSTYSPSTLYPLIAYREDDISNELQHYQHAYRVQH